MKRFSLTFILLITCIFTVLGCSCNKEETVSKEKAVQVLEDAKVNDNVTITTTTETNVNGIKTVSTQTDTYYEDKYYHLSESNNLSTKTWYGYVDNILYAFYYTKNANNEEIKTSSKIEATQLESVKKQPSSIITNLFDENNKLLENYEISATRKGSTYTIKINNNLEEESNIYTITIEDGKVIKIIKITSIASDTIKTTYDYSYKVSDISLPNLNDYPLNING